MNHNNNQKIENQKLQTILSSYSLNNQLKQKFFEQEQLMFIGDYEIL